MFTAEQLSTDSVRRRLNDLATLFVTRLLPRSDMASKPMRTLVAEMVGSYVLWPLVEYLADPATINELVISNVIPLGAASTRERSRKDRKQRSSSQDAMDGGWEGSGRL